MAQRWAFGTLAKHSLALKVKYCSYFQLGSNTPTEKFSKFYCSVRSSLHNLSNFDSEFLCNCCVVIFHFNYKINWTEKIIVHTSTPRCWISFDKNEALAWALTVVSFNCMPSVWSCHRYCSIITVCVLMLPPVITVIAIDMTVVRNRKIHSRCVHAYMCVNAKYHITPTML